MVIFWQSLWHLLLSLYFVTFSSQSLTFPSQPLRHLLLIDILKLTKQLLCIVFWEFCYSQIRVWSSNHTHLILSDTLVPSTTYSVVTWALGILVIYSTPVLCYSGDLGFCFILQILCYLGTLVFYVLKYFSTGTLGIWHSNTFVFLL